MLSDVAMTSEHLHAEVRALTAQIGQMSFHNRRH